MILQIFPIYFYHIIEQYIFVDFFFQIILVLSKQVIISMRKNYIILIVFDSRSITVFSGDTYYRNLYLEDDVQMCFQAGIYDYIIIYLFVKKRFIEQRGVPTVNLESQFFYMSRRK